MPEFIAVDVSALNIHDTIHIEELTLPEGVKAIYDANEAVVTVAPPIVEEKPAEAVEEAAAPAEGTTATEGAAAPAGEEKK